MEKTIENWIMYKATNEELLELVSEVSCWDGSLEEYRFYYMEELDDLFCGVKPTELLSKLADDFDVRDEGFTDSDEGLQSTSIEDAVYTIKQNRREVAETVEDVWDNIYVPDSLMEYLEEE